MKKIRVGIIGTGFGAKVHAPQMQFHDGFDVVAISSVSRGNVEDVKRTSGVEKVYTDWRQMLEQEELDLVSVASAVFIHKEMVLEAFKKGVHVLCEKPMALHIAETSEMVAAKNKAGKIGLINHEFRFLPARTKVKEILESGHLGDLLHIRYFASFPNYIPLVTKPRGWLADEEKGGGMLGAIGSHMIDSLQWFVGNKLTEVFSALPIHIPVQTDENGHTEQRTADDSFQIIGKLSNGATVTIEFVSAIRQSANTWRLEVFGKEGTLLMLDDKEVFVSSGSASLEKVELTSEIKAPAEMPEIAARYYDGFHRMLDALYETLVSGEIHPYLADFETGHSTQHVLDAVRESAREGRKIIIK